MDVLASEWVKKSIVSIGWMVMLFMLTSCGSLATLTLKRKLQHIIPFIFSLNVWFMRAYANGFTAELNMTIV